MTEPEYHGLSWWSAKLGVAEKTLRRAVRAAELPAMRPSPGASAPILVNQEGIDDWIALCRKRGANQGS